MHHSKSKMSLHGFSTTQNVSDWFDFSVINESLPFPLNTSRNVQLVILMLMLTIFCGGLKLRLLILRYLLSPESKGPINALIWADQLNGIFLGLGILLKIAIILCPFPLADVLGTGLCDWTGLPICLYLAGAGSWSCAIAVFRVAIIKGNTLIKPDKLLKVLYLISLTMHFGFGYGIAINDNKNVTRKMCLHNSDIEIGNSELHQVRPFIFQLQEKFINYASPFP